MKYLLPVLLVWATWQTCPGQDASQASTEEQRKEALIMSEYQKGYNSAKQAIFNHYMLHVGNATGIATAVTVNSVKITQWADGEPDGKPNDVQQFQIDLTLYWSSKLHPNDGYTQFVAVYSHRPGKTWLTGVRVTGSNGITNEEALKAEGKVLEAAVLR